MITLSFESLDVISVNLWQLVVSLANLALLFWIVKKFLYQPVKRMLEAREQSIQKDYDDAAVAREQALNDKQKYEEQLSDAKADADGIIQSAVNLAKMRENEILEKAKSDADVIVRQAKEDAQLEMTKAEESIKREIVDVSTVLTSKILEREINSDDHKQIIDSFIEEIGDGYDTN